MKVKTAKTSGCGKTTPAVPKRGFTLAYPAVLAKRSHPWQNEVVPGKSRSPK